MMLAELVTVVVVSMVAGALCGIGYERERRAAKAKERDVWLDLGRWEWRQQVHRLEERKRERDNMPTLGGGAA